MAGPQIAVRLHPDLKRRLEDYMEQTGLTASQAVRDLLRQALTDADHPTRGWHEGFAAGHAQAMRAYHQGARLLRTG